ncbi:glycine betaine ABC transporter substrate-binding protein [Nocardioides sp. R-C-SC26]|uniref:glycine betaine ABC transporter substrate-binding protein n=1 Tax=Nocardioides sp. R-C-SC26 TaxID=2870414 RepID=UPI001E36A4AE|nr:glycine betaine ABC transporter substrate-binding protein [Nocardioides sp. R-C-SC26]
MMLPRKNRSFARPIALASALLLAGTALAACGDDADSDPAGSGNDVGGGASVTVATQNFPEAALVGSLYDVLLSENGFDVQVKAVDARDAYMGEFPGSVDIVPEYLGALGDFLNTRENGEGAEPVTSNDSEATLAEVAPLAEAAGITLLDLSEANSQNAFFVTAEQADGGLEKLSDLEGESIVLAASPDCEGRADCEGGLSGVYGIDITEILPLGFASPETYSAVQSGEAQLGLTGTIDPNLEAEELVLLEDDRGIQPAQNYVPAVATDFLAEHEGLADLLDALMAELDNDVINDLLARVTIDREKSDDVARDFLEEQGLI